MDNYNKVVYLAYVLENQSVKDKNLQWIMLCEINRILNSINDDNDNYSKILIEGLKLDKAKLESTFANNNINIDNIEPQYLNNNNPDNKFDIPLFILDIEELEDTIKYRSVKRSYDDFSNIIKRCDNKIFIGALQLLQEELEFLNNFHVLDDSDYTNSDYTSSDSNNDSDYETGMEIDSCEDKNNIDNNNEMEKE